MPSIALRRWKRVRSRSLNEVERAAAIVLTSGGRDGVRQIYHAYAVLLSAEFQGFCRDLHTESIVAFTASVPLLLQPTFQKEFAFNHAIDRGNPNPGNLGSDFGRLGIKFWHDVLVADPKSSDWRDDLEELNTWRNAVAHNDYDPSKLGGTMLRLSDVRRWRRSCHRLAILFDRVLSQYLLLVTGVKPW